MTLNRQLGSILSKIIGTDIKVQNAGNSYVVSVIPFTKWLKTVDMKKVSDKLLVFFNKTGIKILELTDPFDDPKIKIKLPCSIDDYETLLKLQGYLK